MATAAGGSSAAIVGESSSVYRKATKIDFPELAAAAGPSGGASPVAPNQPPAAAANANSPIAAVPTAVTAAIAATMPLVNAVLVPVPDRRFLLIGGVSAAHGCSLSQVLECDMMSKQWIQGPSLPGPRSEATGALVLPSTVLIFGGYNDDTCVAATMLLQANATASSVSASAATTGAPTPAKGGPGGVAPAAAPADPAAQAMDWKSATWEALDETRLQPSPRRMHASCFMATGHGTPGGRFFIFGGFDGHRRLNDMWEFHTDTMSWSSRSDGATGFLPSARDGATLAADHQGQRLVLFGGYTCNRSDDTMLFDVNTSVWTRVITSVGPAASSPTPRFGCVSIAWGNYCLVGLGQDSKGAAPGIAHHLHIGEGKWAPTTVEGDDIEGRMHASWGIADGGKKLLIFGGTNEKKYSCSLIEVDLERTEAPTAGTAKGGKK